jgi:hypothetical protein
VCVPDSSLRLWLMWRKPLRRASELDDT